MSGLQYHRDLSVPRVPQIMAGTTSCVEYLAHKSMRKMEGKYPGWLKERSKILVISIIFSLHDPTQWAVNTWSWVQR
jgi:hypothetical protein